MTISITGIVQYVELEGGFYGIQADDGATYYPVNLPQQYKAAGTRVSCTAHHLEEAASLAMWGIPIRIVTFEIV